MGTLKSVQVGRINLHIDHNETNNLAMENTIEYKAENIPNTLHKCFICEREFSSVSAQRRHIRNIHGEDTRNLSSKSPMQCPMCSDFRCNKTVDLHRHLEVYHKTILDIQKFTFETMTAFEEWKQQEEIATNSEFVKERGDIQSVDGSRKIMYRCSRSGSFRPQGGGKRALKKQGSRKINAVCPSRMVIKIEKNDEESIQVEYVKTHFGHSLNELDHLSLSKLDRVKIAQQLITGIPSNIILQNVRANMSVPLQRKDLLTQKDVRNIKKAFNISDTTGNTSDFAAVELWVREMKTLRSSNPVLFFKQPNEESPVAGLDKDDLLLIIMTEEQKYMLSKYGSNICIDSTAEAIDCDFELVALFVFDNVDIFPVAFILTSRLDEHFFHTCFEIIKDLNGCIPAKVLMTSESAVYLNAWNTVMGPVEHHLLSTWHVQKSFESKVELIKCSDKRKLVFGKLKDLGAEISQEKFILMYNCLIAELDSDVDTRELSQFLQINYLSRCKQWAVCYRSQFGINNALSIRGFSDIIKHELVDGDAKRRLGKTLYAVMDYIREKEFNRLVNLSKRKVRNKVIAIKDRHLKSLELNKNMVYRDGPEDSAEGYWLVQSSSYSTIWYEVKLNRTCDCHLKCNQCKKCIHAYICTCIDFSIKFNMCKHIHFVCQMRNICNINLHNIENEHLYCSEMKSNNECTSISSTESGVNKNSTEKSNYDDLIEAAKSEFGRLIDMCQSREQTKFVNESLKIIELKLAAVKD